MTSDKNSLGQQLVTFSAFHIPISQNPYVIEKYKNTMLEKTCELFRYPDAPC